MRSGPACESLASCVAAPPQDVRITDLESSFDSQLRQLTNDFHTEMSNIQQQVRA